MSSITPNSLHRHGDTEPPAKGKPPRGSREGWLDRFFYFGAGSELEGGLTAGPLLLPGNPGTLAAS
jgi:hypothetical protein